ncbi:hypothetical protein [Candidatus Cyrtobacter comes]|nr:hypothetical protein [Candidatus Cyrtobacter comes]
MEQTSKIVDRDGAKNVLAKAKAKYPVKFFADGGLLEHYKIGVF